VRGGTGVEVPVHGARRLGGDTGDVQGGVQGTGVEGDGAGGRRRAWWWRLMMGHHGLLGRERRTGAQHTRSRSPERHAPRLDHSGPGVEVGCPWSRGAPPPPPE
jgi:hypothetical protein